MKSPSFWIGVLAQDHARRAIADGFAQVNQGKAGPLERLRAGDGFAIYSPRIEHPLGAPLQAFTAIGRIRTGVVYQVDDGGDFRPFRINVDYLPATPAPIRPLIETLSFIRSKTHWGSAFRFGFRRIPVDDFARIAAALGRDMAADFPAAQAERMAAEAAPA